MERWRAECVANMQADVVKLAIDLLVREPDSNSFFGGLTRTMVEESESHVCALATVSPSPAEASKKAKLKMMLVQS